METNTKTENIIQGLQITETKTKSTCQVLLGEPSCAATKSAVSKDEWDTKEDSDKSINNALYIL